MAFNASELGLESARSGAMLPRPRQSTHSSAASDKLNPDTIDPLVTVTGRTNTASRRMVPPEEGYPAQHDVLHASAHCGCQNKYSPVLNIPLVTVTGDEHWLSSSPDGEKHANRTQRGIGGDPAQQQHRPRQGRRGDDSICLPRPHSAGKTGGVQHKRKRPSPIWDDKAPKSDPSGEYRGVSEDKQTTPVKAVKEYGGKIISNTCTPAKEVKRNGEAFRRAREAAPGNNNSSPSSDRPHISGQVVQVSLYITGATAKVSSRSNHKVAPWKPTVSGSQDEHPSSEGGADKPPDPTEKNMRRTSEGGKEVRLGICRG